MKHENVVRENKSQKVNLPKPFFDGNIHHGPEFWNSHNP